MKILKRSGEIADYERGKIHAAMEKAFIGKEVDYNDSVIDNLAERVERRVFGLTDKVSPSVETIQDIVETVLMEQGFFTVAKAYILYREMHMRQREQRNRITRYFDKTSEIDKVLCSIQSDFADECPLEHLCNKFESFQKPSMTQMEQFSALIKAAVELIMQEAPRWEMAASRLLMLRFNHTVEENLRRYGISCFYEKISLLASQGLYGEYILENYTPEEIKKAYKFIVPERNLLFNYSGLDLLTRRYVIHDHSGSPLETPQEMFLGVALHLAMPEKKHRMDWVKRFYDMLSLLKVSMATPTLSNARKPHHQLSSCFIDTVPDSLNGIFRSVDNFAKVSKYGGGMGLYFGKVRACGSPIRGFDGAAGGVIRWIRIVNDTAVAVDQLGMRQGACAVYIDAWHKDLPEFLQLRTNNGDDRMKAHDIFPAVCYPDLFWKTVKEDINSDWYLMCPHEIKRIKGFSLEDYWGSEWEEKYSLCVADPRISKRVIPVKDIVRMIIKSLVETGTPFAFNRDTVNRANPNSHRGIIYCSNLCTEIAQNMSEIQEAEESLIKNEDGDTVVVSRTKPGEFVVCNLASLTLGRIDVGNDDELRDIIYSAVRALDNVIDLNFYPLAYAEINNRSYRPVGLGVSGYHHMLAKNSILWESEEHLEFADRVFESINYHAISASCKIAAEKGKYDFFQGSQWHTGEYFDKRGYTGEKWAALRRNVKKYGLRNAYLLATAPTSSTSIITGTTAGIDPIMSRYFLEEKKTGLIPRVAPDLSNETRWFYKNAHHIDQSWSVRACGIRQRHIDQSQSMNLYITNDFTFRQILDLYILAFNEGVKTIYYVRSKSLEVDECESCTS